jgi:hypothetical protein
MGTASSPYASRHEGDIVGRLVVGYQGWFACPGDGSPINDWVHWGTSCPRPGHQKFELYPDLSEYERTYETGYATLGNGYPARLFSSFDDQVVQTHFRWMKEYGIDCAALQRFGPSAQHDGMAVKVREAAEVYDRNFYIMYDISGWHSFAEQIGADWLDVIGEKLKITQSPAYAHQEGKPVVCIWGIGFTGRPGSAETCLKIVKWFKEQGCYVIGGVPNHFRDSDVDSKPGFVEVYEAFDMLSPWTPGRYYGIAGADWYRKTMIEDDFRWCQSRGIDYLPVLFPGFAWSNWNGGPRNQIPRLHGDFMWRQFANIRDVGITSAYVAMFDEYDEGTAIAKAAENWFMTPLDQYFLALDADGTPVSSDFYLRLAGDGALMLKGELPLQWSHPTPHTL